MERKKLAGLRPQTYEHSRDTQALNALEGTPGLETLVRKCNEWGLERILRVQYTGSHLRVNADNFPDVYDLVQAAGDTIDLPKLPEVYVAGGGDINAFTAGVERPIVVLNAGAIDCLSEEELLFVIAHELGHVKSGHVLYYQMAEFLPVISEIIEAAMLGFGGLLTTGLQIALLNWKRMSELTADRAGLLGCQNPTAAISAMMKLAGLPQKYYETINTEDFIAQAREFQSLDTDKLSWLAKGLSVMGQTHPWTVMRAHVLLEWIDAGEYDRVLATRHDAMAGAASAPGAGVSVPRFCINCGRALAGTEAFCPGCGIKVQGVGPPA